MSSFTTKSVHHLGFVVANLDETLKAWEALFGVKAEISENAELQVRLGAFNVAGIRFVFNESTHPDSRWAKYLNENGEGLEHIAFEVDSIDKAAETVAEAGLPLRFAEHKLIHGLLTNFVDQDKVHGTAVEFMGPER
jgi:methylmalonyl-CoA/ethylmalonyl-CoA epimerase